MLEYDSIPLSAYTVDKISHKLGSRHRAPYQRKTEQRGEEYPLPDRSHLADEAFSGLVEQTAFFLFVAFDFVAHATAPPV